MSHGTGSVLIVGMGGLGSPAAWALARSGVGTLGLLDDDRVEVSNLHRQILYTVQDVGRLKVEAARDRLVALGARSPRLHPVRLTAESAEAIVAAYDVVADGSDNLATKFLVSDVCVALGKRFVIAGALGWTGQLFPWDKGAACYRCLFEAPPERAPSCQEAGVLGPVCGVVGALEAAAVLALLGQADASSPRPGFIYGYDARRGTLRAVPVRPRAGCQACSATRN